MPVSRGIRLAILTVVAAVVLPGARLILGAMLFTILLVKSYGLRRREGKPYFKYLLLFLVFIVVGYAYATGDIMRINEYRRTHRPVGTMMSKVDDGIYEGKGKGYRAPIKVLVAVNDHRIKDIRIISYRDLAAVRATTVAQLREKILEKGIVDGIAVEPDLLRGAVYTSYGFIAAIEDALVKGIKNYPRAGSFSTTFLNVVIGVPPDSFTINALAIIFAVFLVFDYALQSVLTKDTGQTLTCYNCATCVGACPVKMVEGYQFPMDLVMAARLGDYETVERLSKYCVGCGRCAAKCPAGNSGPSIISAAIRANRRIKEAQEMKAKAKAVPG
ncbi:MAG: 4Fe-4S dicluster domain-containing protein [Syntrophales bacterium]|nr:4Fe-4S dicluster domain-containing protein [Syntrophales bacterium]